MSLKMLLNKIKISTPVLPVSRADYLQILKKIYFISNDKRISSRVSGNILYNEGGIGQCEMDCVREHLTE